MGDAQQRRFLIVVGEPSGDHHGARLARALQALHPDGCTIRGVAGPAMRAAGVEPIVPMESLAVMGFSEVLSRLPVLLRARKRLLEEFDRFQPHVVILVDYPGFNLRIGPQLKARGARVFYYIAPQVWAWHAERAEQMAGWVDELAVVFPFEEEIFRRAGVRTHFVGHPLLDDLAPEVPADTWRADLGLDPNRPVLGLLPGSRRQELDRLLEPMLDTVAHVRRSAPAVACVLAAAPGLAERVPVGAGLHVVSERTHATQAHSTACLVASGTATLETALFATPLVIVYRLGLLNFAIARRVVQLERIGLPNIVCGEDVAPEFVQHLFEPRRVAEALIPWLTDPALRERQSRRLRCVREKLGGPGASRRTAERIVTLAESGS